MDHGVVTFLTDYGVEPLALARSVEEHGFDALFLTEHTHIPTSRTSPWPGGAELPQRYSHTFDPFVALSAMAVATERIVLGTGVSLVAQHDPISLAKTVASVDRISGGRFELGVGPGWNKEEMANHGVDPRRPTARMREHVLAMQEIWSKDEPAFHGTYVDFDPIWSWPKPTRRPPVLIGGGGPTVLDRVLEYGDGWIPLRVTPETLPEYAQRIAELRGRAAELGRDHVNVTIYGAVPTPEAIAAYEAAGVDRVLFELPDRPDALSLLDDWAGLR
ncbi:LLM class F420-dependent oxidoreductase [Actinomycetes bacterium KLBMP 9759]